MSTLIDAEELLKVIGKIGENELLSPDEMAVLVERQPEVFERRFKDGYIMALCDLTELVSFDLYKPLTFYDEGVNTGLRKAIDVADYLIQKMKSGGVKNHEDE